jgi:hypothetical protein
MKIAAVPQKTPSVFLGLNFSIVPITHLITCKSRFVYDSISFCLFRHVSCCHVHIFWTFVSRDLGISSGQCALCSTLLCNPVPYSYRTLCCPNHRNFSLNILATTPRVMNMLLFWSSLFSWPTDYTAVALWAVQHSRQTSALCGAIVLLWYMKPGCLTYLHNP